MELNCAIFDFDGTLFDTMPWWRHSAYRYLRSRGIDPPPTIDEECAELTLIQAAQLLKDRFALAASLEEIADGVKAVVKDAYLRSAPPKPGAVAFVRALHEAGVQVCIATATDRCLVEAALARCGLGAAVSRIFTCDEVGHGKGEPDIYRLAMASCGADRGSTLVFEDALHAVRTAAADGFAVVSVADAYERRQDEVRALSCCHLEDFGRFEHLVHLEHIEDLDALRCASASSRGVRSSSLREGGIGLPSNPPPGSGDSG